MLFPMARINKASENQNTTKWLGTAKSHDPPPAQSSHAVQRTLSAPTQSSITFTLKKDFKYNQFLDVLAQKKSSMYGSELQAHPEEQKDS